MISQLPVAIQSRFDSSDTIVRTDRWGPMSMRSNPTVSGA